MLDKSVSTADTSFRISQSVLVLDLSQYLLLPLRPLLLLCLDIRHNLPWQALLHQIQAPVLNNEKRSVCSVPHPWWPLFSCLDGRSTGPTWEGMSRDVPGDRGFLWSQHRQKCTVSKSVYATETSRNPPLRLLAECSTGQDSPCTS